MDHAVTSPSLRKPVGVLLILAIITLWGALIAAASPWIAALPSFIEAALYLIAGVIWIAPLRPLLAWMETGRFRR